MGWTKASDNALVMPWVRKALGVVGKLKLWPGPKLKATGKTGFLHFASGGIVAEIAN